MTHICGSELEALASLERMYGLALELAKRAGLDDVDLADAKVKQTGRYSSGTWTIECALDNADAVLERAKGRKVGSKSRRPFPQKYIASDPSDWTNDDDLIAFKNASKREQARLIREAQDEEEALARRRAEEVL